MIFQNHPDLDREIREIGCAFMCPIFFRDKYQHMPMDVPEINGAWREARRAGIINPPDHPTAPLEVASWQALLNHLGVKLRVLNHTLPNGTQTTHWPSDTPIPAGCWGFYAWYNPRTRFTHFVVGKERPVEYDPISTGSITVREGAPKPDGLRLFQITI